MTHNPGTVQNLKQHRLIDPTHQVPCFVNADLDYQQAARCTSIVKDAELYSIMHYWIYSLWSPQENGPQHDPTMAPLLQFNGWK